jgi:hypothetical protein
MNLTRLIAIALATLVQAGMCGCPGLSGSKPDNVDSHVKSAEAEDSTISTSEPEKSPPSSVAIDDVVRRIDTALMLSHVSALSERIGPRKEGSAEERMAAHYFAEQLRSFGYIVLSESVAIPRGLTSRNVWAILPGERDQIILIGAHLDSKLPSPGANDNASGIAVVLELARIFRDIRPPYTCMFVGFGAEEMSDTNPDHHHYGSRQMAKDSALRAKLHSVISIDMAGVGNTFWVNDLSNEDDALRQHLFQKAAEMGLPCSAGDEKPWSDHEAFELLDVPAAWIHWRWDPANHTASDTVARISADKLGKTVQFMAGVIFETDNSDRIPLSQ